MQNLIEAVDRAVPMPRHGVKIEPGVKREPGVERELSPAKLDQGARVPAGAHGERFHQRAHRLPTRGNLGGPGEVEVCGGEHANELCTVLSE